MPAVRVGWEVFGSPYGAPSGNGEHPGAAVTAHQSSARPDGFFLIPVGASRAPQPRPGGVASLWSSPRRVVRARRVRRAPGRARSAGHRERLLLAASDRGAFLSSISLRVQRNGPVVRGREPAHTRGRRPLAHGRLYPPQVASNSTNEPPEGRRLMASANRPAA